MKWFKIDGKEWDVRIFDPVESFSILYSPNTGRMLGEGAPMFLDPLGTFFNYKITVGAKRGKEKEFESLWEYLSIPRQNAISFVFPKNSNGVWKTLEEKENGDQEEIEGFMAYVSNGERGIKRIIEDFDGEMKSVEYDSFSINFIATKAQVKPTYD